MGLGVLSSQELVVGVIDVQLHWVLIVSKESIMSIGKISKSTSEIERVFNWRGVVHGSEEVVLGGEDNDLFKKAVAHQELLSSSGDVSVTVLNSHARESGLLHLKGNSSGHVDVDLSLLRGMNTRVGGGGEDVEAFVSDFIDHIKYNY